MAHSDEVKRGSAAPVRAAVRRLAGLAFVLAVAFAGTNAFAGERETAYRKFSDIDGKRIGVLTGTLFDYLVNSTLEQTRLFYYDALDPMLRDLRDGKIDCVVDDEPALRHLAMRDPRYRLVPDNAVTFEYAMLVRDEEPELAVEFNRVLEELLEEGVVAELVDKWMRGDGEATADSERYSGSRLVRLGVFTEAPPFVFRDALHNIVGIDIELAERVCRRLGYRLEINAMSMDSLFDALADNTADIVAASIAVTDERKQLGTFTIPYYQAGPAALVLDNK